jgi:hypothetical protein
MLLYLDWLPRFGLVSSWDVDRKYLRRLVDWSVRLGWKDLVHTAEDPRGFKSWLQHRNPPKRINKTFLCQYSVRVATPEIDYHS